MIKHVAYMCICRFRYINLNISLTHRYGTCYTLFSPCADLSESSLPGSKNSKPAKGWEDLMEKELCILE